MKKTMELDREIERINDSIASTALDTTWPQKKTVIKEHLEPRFRGKTWTVGFRR